ncbi:glycine zipper domain-containing protein [Flavisphingomonas formosensis]|uniref:glycine zipper domain-containing protein n=1 Tax=Flavisphingomonas formosensis TaxID=861534 RepID=UPI0012F70CEB|nr:glycine zipper domain-containing protein [Sphingomonas formosensis]
MSTLLPSALSAAQAQQAAPYAEPPPGYDDQAPPPGYYPDDGNPPPDQPPPGYAGQMPMAAPPPPPPGYDGSQIPPPPPGYAPGPDDDRQEAQDRAYADYTQQWAQANCVKAHANSEAAAVLGGAVGALLGSSVAGRHDRGAGAILGAGVGAVGGAAIADSSASHATSPGCPPGYVVRSGAPPFAYDGPAYVYAAPDWYDPWLFYGGVWTYRPYPYHVWYYHHYRWGRPGYRPGYYGRYGRPHGYYRHR